MKILLVSALLIFISVTSFKLIGTQPKQISTIQKTLNGYSYDDFKTMKDHFELNRGKDLAPKNTSIWFSKDVLHNIVLLLNSEIAAQKKAKQKDITDGIRIYFLSDPSLASGTSLTYKIGLVSTLSHGTKYGKDGVLYYWHLDYFNHPDTGKLSSLLGVHGNPSIDKTDKGAFLYNLKSGNSDDRNCDPTLPHYVKLKDAEAMVLNFGNDSIKTFAAWFDIKFWRDLDNEKDCNGIRIYFMRYTNSYAVISYRNKDSFVITTTHPGDVTASDDYYTCATQKITARKNLYNKIQSNEIDTSKAGPPTNNGQLCPFNCN